jgi:hypothetical protein
LQHTGVKILCIYLNKVKNSIVFTSYCTIEVIIILFRRLGIVNYLCVIFIAMINVFKLKFLQMKRIFFVFTVVAFMAAIFSSCTASRKSRTGCPGTEGIIH